MKISIIIPCRNEAEHVREFLDSALEQELDPGQETEVLIADGMSTDGTREVIREYTSRIANVRMIDNPQKIVSTGLNEAIRQSAGEIIVRMDGHTVYAPDYLRECVRALLRSGADNAGGPWIARGRGTIGRAIAAAFQSRFCAGGGKAHDPGYEGEVDTVYLGCWRREVFDKAGLFDPHLVRNQDDEFNFRLRRLGLRVWQSPRIQSVYTPRASFKALFHQYAQYGFWKVVVIRKHRSMASARHAVPGIFVMSLLILAALSTVSRVAAGLLALEAGAYAIACLAATLACARSLELRALVAVPAAIVTYHVSYGLGFLTGLLKVSTGSGRFFTVTTR